MFNDPLPHATEIEASVLAACLIHPMDAIPECLDDLVEKDFYTSKHQVIWKAIHELAFFKEPVELMTVAQKLSDTGMLETAGGAVYLSSMINSVPMSTTISYHIRIIKEKRALRDSIEACNAILKRAFSDNPAAETIEKFHTMANAIEIDSTETDLKTMPALTMEHADTVDALQDSKGALTGSRSGFHALDNLTNGFQKGDLIILSARPSMGKTALAVNMGKAQAEFGIQSGFFSLEQPGRQLYNRMVADVCDIDANRFNRGGFDEGELKLINDAQNGLYDLPLWIDDKGSLSIEEICSRARRYKQRKGLRILYVDHLQLVYSNQHFNSRNDELGYITSRLKGLAKDLDITVVCLSQLNRSLENRPNPHKRPRLSDLRDSGNIEQDADIVIFIYRPEKYGDDDSVKWPGYACVYLGKNRNGPIGECHFVWEVVYTRFREVDMIHDQNQYPIGYND